MTTLVSSKQSGWQAAHEALTRLARTRAGLDFEEGQQLRAAQLARVHERLGYGSFVEYIERLFGYVPRLTLEKLRVAEALERLPALADALRIGNASWSSLRELTRVATGETEREWLAAARGKTVREVERLVSGHRPGDWPGSPNDSRAERHVLRFEVSGDVLATFREAVAKLRQDAGASLDDDAVLLMMARHVLAETADDGRASYQLAVTICESCARATQRGCGDPVAIEPEIAEMARCDAQKLGDASWSGGRPRRASQTIPPAVRRTVLQRDHHRCQVPGCRHATFVDVHHLRARAEGGNHDTENLITLCGAHHRACHRGDLLIEKSPTGTLEFRHADGTTYGEVPSPAALDVMPRALQALRILGFGEREARDALHEVHAHVGIGDENRDEADYPTNHGRVEGLIRGALELLTRNSWAKAS
ncbi:MAG TPA: HNH endonuclease signature motif containing protein [Polyangiaceae bacterium]|nr:HNH endonuclease signature motif containing protein [Polyangiaceae bacterium]